MFSRIRAFGLWLLNSTVEPEEWEQFDANLANAIDGDGGGAYAPTSIIEIGGEGLTDQRPKLEVLTSSGTWTKPTWARHHRFYIVGGGGGGGGGHASVAGGGGGGSGKLRIVDAASSDLAATLTYTVGTAGAGGAIAGAGSNGVASSVVFDDYTVTAPAGALGGAGNGSTGGAGGAGFNGGGGGNAGSGAGGTGVGSYEFGGGENGFAGGGPGGGPLGGQPGSAGGPGGGGGGGPTLLEFTNSGTFPSATDGAIGSGTVTAKGGKGWGAGGGGGNTNGAGGAGAQGVVIVLSW